MFIAPAINLIPAAGLFLASLLVVTFPFPLLFAEEIVVTNWDKGYRYEAIANGEPIVIYLEEEIEEEVEEEKSKHYPKPGKVKIVFEDSKQKGTKLIYERDMEDGDISEIDRIYIQKVLTSIEKFHKENHSLNGRVKDTISNFLNSVRKVMRK